MCGSHDTITLRCSQPRWYLPTCGSATPSAVSTCLISCYGSTLRSRHTPTFKQLAVAVSHLWVGHALGRLDLLDQVPVPLTAALRQIPASARQHDVEEETGSAQQIRSELPHAMESTPANTHRLRTTSCHGDAHDPHWTPIAFYQLRFQHHASTSLRAPPPFHSFKLSLIVASSSGSVSAWGLTWR